MPLDQAARLCLRAEELWRVFSQDANPNVESGDQSWGMSMRILIIGCGYLGHRAAEMFLRRGDIVTALTRSPQRAEEWRKEGIEPIVGDVLAPESLAQLPEVDRCVYAVGYDRTATADKRTVYVEGLRNVLNAVQSRVRHFLYVSSTSVYGQNFGEWVDESSPTQPTSPDGQICREAELLVQNAFSDTQAENRAVILRLAGIYGPGRLIGRREQLIKQVPIQANPEGWLNLIHVDDAVLVLEALTDPRRIQNGFPAPVYLVSDEAPLRRREFYETFAQLLGAPAPRFETSESQGLNKRCDSRRVRTELGVTLRYPNALKAIEGLLVASDR